MTAKLTWFEVWRQGIAPLLSVDALTVLRRALRRDDPRLIQRDVLKPDPLWGPSLACQAACALAFCGWQGQRLETVQEIDNYFRELCAQVDRKLGPRAAWRFTAWFDAIPRSQMRRALLREVERSLRASGSTGPRNRLEHQFMARVGIAPVTSSSGLGRKKRRKRLLTATS